MLGESLPQRQRKVTLALTQLARKKYLSRKKIFDKEKIFAQEKNICPGKNLYLRQKYFFGKCSASMLFLCKVNIHQVHRQSGYIFYGARKNTIQKIKLKSFFFFFAKLTFLERADNQEINLLSDEIFPFTFSSIGPR